VTWKRTSFPVPNGSKNLSVIAAIIAQKKLKERCVNTCYKVRRVAGSFYLLHMTFGGKK
jgi:hypothetical protein